MDNCILVREDEVLDFVELLRNKIKEKDLEQLAVTRKYGIKYLIAFDRDFEGFEEYKTPKEFLEILEEEVSEEEF